MPAPVRVLVIDDAGLERFCALPTSDAEQLLLAVCSSPQWARRVAAGRPYPSGEDLLQAADEALGELSEREIDAALAGHPRIGERTAAGSLSHTEQAGLAGASTRVREELVEGNRAYEERFGHVYLVCATGRSAGELLALLRERLGHDRSQERGALREELRKINRIRLGRLLSSTDVA